MLTISEPTQCFQFLGIPPKGELEQMIGAVLDCAQEFPISRDPPEGGTDIVDVLDRYDCYVFPISRDPPEGGTARTHEWYLARDFEFPISRDPPEGGTS